MIGGETEILTVFKGKVEAHDLEIGDLLYSFDPEAKVPAVAAITEKMYYASETPLIWVLFDSGLLVAVAPEHEFVHFHGQRVQAMELKPNMSIRAFSMSQHRGDGHYRVHGWVNGVAKHKYVARLIWEYYHGPVPFGMIIHHIDFSKTNNDIKNLELVDQTEHNRLHYPYRADGGFKRYNPTRNHKVVNIMGSGDEDSDGIGNIETGPGCYIFEMDKYNIFVLSDPVPVSGIESGVLTYCDTIPSFSAIS
jgi:hypothetical protein